MVNGEFATWSPRGKHWINMMSDSFLFPEISTADCVGSKAWAHIVRQLLLPLDPCGFLPSLPQS